ncbi:unnamed protein product [Protopolystoma xenopodis]|uniref:Uncharacterized protein n=1 Tax=Protopolystoma xenopodis TaxID=117903 RepID=A0A448XLQ3_9PLAT|nr:unnamed protein product [Protopolystoma xenopodis]
MIETCLANQFGYPKMKKRGVLICQLVLSGAILQEPPSKRDMLNGPVNGSWSVQQFGAQGLGSSLAVGSNPGAVEAAVRA